MEVLFIFKMNFKFIFKLIARETLCYFIVNLKPNYMFDVCCCVTYDTNSKTEPKT